MGEIEKTCENCQYDLEGMEGKHCRHCIHSAEEHFKPKEEFTEEQRIRNKAIDEFMSLVVAEYDNDGCPNVTDYLDYRLTIRELFNIAEQMKGE